LTRTRRVTNPVAVSFQSVAAPSGGPDYLLSGSPQATRSSRAINTYPDDFPIPLVPKLHLGTRLSAQLHCGPLPLSGEPGTQTSPSIDVEEKLKDAFERGWSVTVWNDPVNLMDYVVYIFKSVLKMSDQDAAKHMLEVHQKGKSRVAHETKEKAEMLVHRLRGFGLNATMEKA